MILYTLKRLVVGTLVTGAFLVAVMLVGLAVSSLNQDLLLSLIVSFVGIGILWIIGSVAMGDF